MNMLSLKKPHCLKKISNLGFTLVEMLVTISIMLVITGGGIASFINFNDRQNVQVAVKELQTLLRSAQVKAKVGEGADFCRATPGDSLRGYRVFVANGSSTAVLEIVCSPNKFSPIKTYTERNTVEFDSNVAVSLQGGGNIDFEFLTLLGGIDGFGAGTLAVIEISGLGSDVYSFTLTSGGEIRDGGFL